MSVKHLVNRPHTASYQRPLRAACELYFKYWLVVGVTDFLQTPPETNFMSL